MTQKNQNSTAFVIFTTVLIDLIGFGMVIPLISLYGKYRGASGIELSILGGIYSFMQFFFAPIWGKVSDRVGRRPILLLSLAGSTFSYLIFAFAPNYAWLLISRTLGGIFAANISTAQAYIADTTTPENRAKGMGMIGAAFGIGFTLGPPLGGIASHRFGLAAPGLIAASICGLNGLIALFRLPESLPKSMRAQGNNRSFAPLNFSKFRATFQHNELGFLLMTFFWVTLAFSVMEQTFSLLFQTKFNFSTSLAGYKTGLILMFAGLLGAIVQGGLIRRWVPRYGEHPLIFVGLILNTISMALFPYCPLYSLYFILIIPLSLGSSLINPSLSALISKNVSAQEQGETLGLSQGLGSLARALGPFCGLLCFEIRPELPYALAGLISLSLVFIFLSKMSRYERPLQNLAESTAAK